jgi:CelD/BcsL family acetyltransferase involved in cellulose biosynthesis
MSRTAEELERDLAAFVRLHHARWEGKGGSAALTPERERMLAAACRELLDSERARLWSIDVEGRTISSQLFVVAGGEVAYWLGGFDEAFAAQRPALLALVVAIEDAFRRGERGVDLGPGAQDYKYRLADGDEILEDVTVVLGGPLARVQLAPGRLRRAAGRLKRRVRGADGPPGAAPAGAARPG